MFGNVAIISGSLRHFCCLYLRKNRDSSQVSTDHPLLRRINFEAETHPFVRHDGGRQRRPLLLEVERLQPGDEQLPL